ncbi:hypothetical protein ACL7TT_06755 [Microbulbifer sp. 2304DJ12-6]|uniref:hypothetical protein n=1 Tax=Microbulbifer sp. 2304DJ12-6 TaxID=3233340 RepID=UPI0039B11B34
MKQAKTFFGPDLHWQEEYRFPSKENPMEPIRQGLEAASSSDTACYGEDFMLWAKKTQELSEMAWRRGMNYVEYRKQKPEGRLKSTAGHPTTRSFSICVYRPLESTYSGRLSPADFQARALRSDPRWLDASHWIT